MRFNEFRTIVNTRVLFLEKQSKSADRKAVKTGKVNDRIEAIEFRAQLEELRKVIEHINNITQI